MALTPLLERAKVIVALGPGGVGKTTTAAALALKAARTGRKTLVCTIDPARRLASSLGVELGDEPTPVPPERFERAGLPPTTGLHAMMLDAATALDRMLLSAGRDPEPSAAILDSQSVKTTEKGGRAATTPGRR